MSGGAEMIAGAVVQRLAGMLGNKAWERVELLWNFKEDVEGMERIMIDLKLALSYADKRSRESDGRDELVQPWLTRYKSVAYDIEDALDELVANATIWENSKCTVKLFFSSINPLIVRITMSNKTRNIRMKLDKIVEDQKKFPLQQLMPTPTSQDGNKNRNETFIGDRDEIKMVGRGKEKKGILNKMLQKYRDQESSIIPIVGLGGMGKTTLAKVVYTDKETNMFDVKAWVHVSMDFDLSKIVSAIISQVENSTPVNNAGLQYLKSQLDRIFHDKFYLIVLDDLWEEGRSELENLINMLQSGNKGSGLPTDLEDIGKGIACRCSGVPLVAKALGFVMQKHYTIEEWMDIKNSNILDIKDDDKGILNGLLLSYYHMPPELKLCFMYCSIFPKSHDIDHDCLIQLWIALGFVQGADRQLLQKTGIEYVDEFLGMSFLNIQTSSTALVARIFKPTLKLRMHDMVHDLARLVAADEFSYTNGATNFSAKKDKLNSHFHLMINQNETSLDYTSFLKKVRALHFRGCDRMDLPKQSFSQMLCLRVLDLSGCHLSDLPSSVYKLKLLRFLDASTLPISNLSKSLNHLLNLQTLILANSSLKTLPANIGCLQKLQYFDLSGCVNLCELPISFGNLSALLFLNLASCHELHTLPESFGKLHMLQFLNLSNCYKLHLLPESCCRLHGLAHLDLSDCHNLEKLPDCIDQLSKLEYLNMTSCSKGETKPQRVNRTGIYGGSGDLWGQIVELEKAPCHDLHIIGLENVKHLEGAEQAKISNNSSITWLTLIWEHDKDFPSWMLDIPSYLPHLTSIFLSELKGCSRLPPLGRLPNLRALALSDMPDLKCVDREFYGDYGSCQKLRMIVLNKMDNLESWWTTRSSTEEGEFLIPNLHLLAAMDCPKLKFMPYPPRSMVWMLENCEHVLPEHGFGNLSSSTSPFFLVIGGTSLSSEWWRRTQHISSIEGLELNNITGLGTLPEAIRCFRSLRKLAIVLCADLETLPEWLGDLTSLREIRIDECPKVSLLPESIHGLTELKKLRIINCPELFEKCQGEDKHKIAHIPEVTSV
ncbi:unnamed protein product [Miscanthus lutarioriparius]|uniref:Uncharacterized protein n=1 Tax=Miscanthus lutarioriparius TaxID=422564 RepID=A0A811NNL7_9POAL|nr:unnamed protein product [Miscanthus lutarioriparius]